MTAYYISTSGSDGNPGSSVSPWLTFDHAIPLLAAGDTLILKDGTYNDSNSGFPDIVFGVNAVNGTSDFPITIRAENERQAFIEGNGDQYDIHISGCSYWTFEGLRLASADSNGASQAQLFLAESCDHLVIRRLLLSHANRYQNSSLLNLDSTDNTLVEENECYYFHRHAIISKYGTGNTFRRNYANSRFYADIIGGYASGDSTRGDSAFIIYPGSDNIVENNISENNTVGYDIEAELPSEDNQFFGNISLNDNYGALLRSREDIPANNTFTDLLIIGATNPGVYARSALNTQCVNCSVFNSGQGFVADKPGDVSNDGSLFVTNSLAFGNGTGFNIVDQADWGVDYSQAYSNSTNYSPALPANYTNMLSADPEITDIFYYVPASSPLHAAGLAGADVGANILYRYVDGVLTGEPLWDPATGAFVSGGIVTGLNDVAGESCFDVNERLNVTADTLPAGYFNPGGTPPMDDFDAYAASSNLEDVWNGGTGTWTAPGVRGEGSAMTIVTAPGGGQGGNCVRSITGGAGTYYYREFLDVDTDSFTFEMRSDITNPNHDNYGVSYHESGIGKRCDVHFSSAGLIEAYNATGSTWVSLGAFSANTWYRIELAIDAAGHPGQYRVKVNEGTFSAWLTATGSLTVLNLIQFNNKSTNGTIHFDAIGSTTPPAGANISQMILDKILKDTAFAVFPVWLSLHTGPTGLTGANEVTGGSYGRFPASESYWGTPANRAITNALEMQFAAMPVTTVTWVGLWSASSGGTFIRGVALNNPKALKAGDVPKFEVGSLSFQLTADFSTFLANELLAYLFTGTAFTSAPAYWSLHTGAKDDTGGNEVTGGSYGRQEATIADWAATGDSILGDTVFSLDFEALVEFTAMPAAELTRLGLFDASSSGHFLMWGPSTPLSVGSGETVSIDGTVAGTLGATLTEIP